jgi:hypothetical protein
MAELRVTRADLVSFARNNPADQIELSNIDRPLITSVRSIEDVTFVDDDGTEYPLKRGNGELHAPRAHPDYLDRREPSEGNDAREGIEGSVLRHHDTRGPGTAPPSNADPSSSDGVKSVSDDDNQQLTGSGQSEGSDEGSDNGGENPSSSSDNASSSETASGEGENADAEQVNEQDAQDQA